MRTFTPVVKPFQRTVVVVEGGMSSPLPGAAMNAVTNPAAAVCMRSECQYFEAVSERMASAALT